MGIHFRYRVWHIKYIVTERREDHEIEIGSYYFLAEFGVILPHISNMTMEKFYPHGISIFQSCNGNNDSTTFERYSVYVYTYIHTSRPRF